MKSGQGEVWKVVKKLALLSLIRGCGLSGVSQPLLCRVEWEPG